MEILAGGWRASPSGGPKVTNPIVPVRLSNFTGFAGSVGTELIRGERTRDWLTKALAARSSMNLSVFCEDLALELTRIWQDDAAVTHLSVFVAGYCGGTPAFWFVSNGEPPDGSSSTLPVAFDAVNDLGGRFAEVNAQQGETQADLIARTQPSFRRGALEATLLFDGFTRLIAETMGSGQVPPIDSLARYAAYVRFRFEFTKRMYDPSYGIGADELHRPVDGTIHVCSVSRAGDRLVYGKHLGQEREVI